MYNYDQGEIPVQEEKIPSSKKTSNDYICKILYINQDPAIRNISGGDFSRHQTVSSFLDAAWILQNTPVSSDEFPDVIVSDYSDAVSKDISKFLAYLRHDQNLTPIPFILFQNSKEQISDALAMPFSGIDDVVSGDISMKELQIKVNLLKKFRSLQNKDMLIKEQAKTIPEARNLLYKIDPYFKRFLDIVIASMAFVILFPLLLLISIIIKLESRGPLFYTAYRAGANYRIFKFIKFRSMIANADEKITELSHRNQYRITGNNKPVFFKISQDPRVTKFGRFLRNTSLDELPQLYNILKGDMSLVGNRPLPLYEAKSLTTDRYVERFNAPAGLTGLWQVTKRGKKKMSEEERIALDIHYARKRSLLYDWKIMLHTPKALFQKEDV